MTSREKNPKSKREKWRQQDVEIGWGGVGGGGGLLLLVVLRMGCSDSSPFAEHGGRV